MSDDERVVKQENNDQPDEENTMRILVATDIHLGYEQSTKRAQDDDSFIAFEEILKYARDLEVDFILLGGDLFHDSKPSQSVIMKCIHLLRTYCLGNKPIKVEFLTDPGIIFNHCLQKTVNYEDPNLNVGIPVFSIHGNHDDPSFGTVGSLDVLSATGLVNYFGKWSDVTQVTIAPLILRKGVSNVALYGLSYMNDQRLTRLMRREKMEMLRPNELEDCFNILVLHQNRAKHGKDSYIEQERIPDFINLVIWGHEHECRLTPESVPGKNFFISQPGSSVATSLCEGEAVPKHVGLLSIYKSKFKMTSLKLNTVRPFVFDTIFLDECSSEISKYKTRADAVCDFVDGYIENTLIPKATEQFTGDDNQPTKPLIRLRVVYSEDRDAFEALRLSQKYTDVVANPMDMILMRKFSGNLKNKRDKSDIYQEINEMGDIFQFDDKTKDWNRTVQGGIADYFSKDDNCDKLTVLSVAGLNEALSRFVDTNDTKAFQDLVKHQMQKTIEFLRTQEGDTEEEITESIKHYRNIRLSKQKEEEEDVRSFLGNKSKRDRSSSRTENTSTNDDDDDSDAVEEVQPTRGRGRGRGSRARGTKATTTAAAPTKRGRGRASAKASNSSILDITTSGAGNRTLDAWRSQKTPNLQRNDLDRFSKPKDIEYVISDSD